MGFLDTVIKDSGNEFAGLVSEGVAAGDITNYVDTGSSVSYTHLRAHETR